MAPEVVLGNGRADHRADLYSLGCVAHFLLTGRRPFEADHAMKVLLQHIQDDAAAPSLRTELTIPQSVDDLVLMCLHKDPSHRPLDASALQQRHTAPAWKDRITTPRESGGKPICLTWRDRARSRCHTATSCKCR
jgi:serine/threonine protein kinase